MSRNAYAGGHWKHMRELTRETNAILREQRRLVSAYLQEQHPMFQQRPRCPDRSTRWRCLTLAFFGTEVIAKVRPRCATNIRTRLRDERSAHYARDAEDRETGA